MLKISFTTEGGKEITGDALNHGVESSPDKMIDCTCYGDRHKRYMPGPTTTKLHVSLPENEKSSEILNYLMKSLIRKTNIKLKLDKEGNIIIRGYGSVMKIEDYHIVFLMDLLEYGSESCVE